MCPECHEPLVVYEMDGVEIDHCLRCRGTWLDRGELVLLAEIVGAGSDDMTAALERSVRGPKTDRRCPRCRRRLRLIRLGRDGSIETDRCARGHGLWLDAGEMLAVIRSYADRDDGRIARYFAELYRSEIEAGDAPV